VFGAAWFITGRPQRSHAERKQPPDTCDLGFLNRATGGRRDGTAAPRGVRSGYAKSAGALKTGEWATSTHHRLGGIVAQRKNRRCWSGSYNRHRHGRAGAVLNLPGTLWRDAVASHADAIAPGLACPGGGAGEMHLA